MELQKTKYKDLLSELISLVKTTKQNVVSYANISLTMLFWQVGNHRILAHTLAYKRADYGKEIVVTLSRQLSWSHFLVLFTVKKTESLERSEQKKLGE